MKYFFLFMMVGLFSTINFQANASEKSALLDEIWNFHFQEVLPSYGTLFTDLPPESDETIGYVCGDQLEKTAVEVISSSFHVEAMVLLIEQTWKEPLVSLAKTIEVPPSEVGLSCVGRHILEGREKAALLILLLTARLEEENKYEDPRMNYLKAIAYNKGLSFIPQDTDISRKIITKIHSWEYIEESSKEWLRMINEAVNGSP